MLTWFLVTIATSSPITHYVVYDLRGTNAAYETENTDEVSLSQALTDYCTNVNTPLAYNDGFQFDGDWQQCHFTCFANGSYAINECNSQ